jgi:hypothetical protein
MKRTINSPTGFSPVEKEKRNTSPTIYRTSSQSSLISTTSSVRRELDRALAFENGPMRDRITVDILKIDKNDFKGTISPIEAKNLIYINTLGLDRNLLHSLDISFKGHIVITYRLREQINVDTTFESEDFVFEIDSGSGRSLLRGKIRGLRIQSHHQYHQHQHPMTRWVKLENCQWAFGEEKILEWLSKFGKPLTPLEEETYSFGSNDEDDCQDAVGTGNLSAKMTIEQEIPQFLPIMGPKVPVYYRGITKLCINCYQPGHIKKNCKNPTVGWIDYVQKFKEENDFSDDLYGNWIKILDLNQVRKEKEKQSKEDSTLRMSETKEKVRKQQQKMKKKLVFQKKKIQQWS